MAGGMNRTQTKRLRKIFLKTNPPKGRGKIGGIVFDEYRNAWRRLKREWKSGKLKPTF